MATKTDSTILAWNDTDAHFRAWAQFIHDVFALAWIQTSDTGQITIASATKPGAGSTAVGYEIWRMDDSLQGTAPVFAKVEYGSGAAATTPSIWLTLGTGSDGAGGITDIRFARTQILSGNNGGATTQPCYGSADTNRITCAMFLTTNTVPFWFAVERRKVPGTSTGEDDDTGLIVAWGGSTSAHKSQVCPFASVAPTAETGIQCILSVNNPTAYTGDQGIGLMIPMLGVADQPGMNVCLTMSSDFAEYAQPSFTLYGSSRTYQHMGNRITTLRVGTTDASTRLLLRYD